MESMHVELAGASLEVATTGEGPPVVLLASLGRSAVADYAALADELADARFTAISIDARAVANSVGTLDGLDLHDLAADVAGVCVALGTGPVHVVGHALGNRIARCVAARDDALVRSVTLLAAGGKVAGDEEAHAALLRCFDVTVSDDEHLEAVATAFFASGNDASVWRDGWYPAAAFGQGMAVARTPVESWWTAFSAPTLVVQGSDDRIAPPENGRDVVVTLRGAGTRAELVEVTQAGHALLPEQPALVASAVIGFLRREEAQSRTR